MCSYKEAQIYGGFEKCLLTGQYAWLSIKHAMAFAAFMLISDYWCCMVKEDIPKMIKKLRTTLELTQEQFAAKVGVTFSTVNRWESGKSKPSPLAMKQIKNLVKNTGRNR